MLQPWASRKKCYTHNSKNILYTSIHIICVMLMSISFSMHPRLIGSRANASRRMGSGTWRGFAFPSGCFLCLSCKRQKADSGNYLPLLYDTIYRYILISHIYMIYDIYIYMIYDIYIYDTYVHTHTHIYIYIYTYHAYICVYIYISCVYVYYIYYVY